MSAARGFMVLRPSVRSLTPGRSSLEAWELSYKRISSLISAYCGMNLTEASKRSDEVAKAVQWAGIVKKFGGKVAVIGPNGVKRDTYDFAANKANIVAALNDICQAVSDTGITPVLHQHTGTCVETRDETYAVLNAVNTKYVRFGPDIGQLTKGGSDAVQVVKDFLPLIEHMHLKDYDGKDRLGYVRLLPARPGEGRYSCHPEPHGRPQTPWHGDGRTGLQ